MTSQSGLFMPAEWSRHRRTLTAWPDQGSLRDGELEGAEHDVASISNAIAEFEPVTLLCRPQNIARAKQSLSSAIDIQEMEVNELWLRDTGPVYVKNAEGKVLGIDFNFNYWGAKYAGTDQRVARSILGHDETERVEAPLVAEGGGIEVDGDGTLLVTESSVINNNRNPGQTKEQLESHLKTLLGVQKVIWLKGLRGLDITDAHIDATARFAAPGRVILNRPAKTANRAYIDAWEDDRRVLAAERDARGRRLEVVELEEADPARFDGDEYETCLSYLNYLLVNGGLVMPGFGDREADERALMLLQRLFPDRKVVQVRLDFLRKLGGGIHCATQQQPE
ncbi:Peptidyl-arginine deiminase, Porphyromonas-type [Cordyceps fumosorosea ARSEF 2679]|uniref:Peptidyl-arginine deiminase, Porphyromonas-type n=1 Tax=Cordyceps fumosorosea (strain ARSEF 2679) TaxID=1081104 RepID=A0A167VZ52_CORFA|nr:Peptidyl-arginine deiminase, Porphyromonas-type [Cordyceps fumosorosea ARSEF 2679]OAA63139.1 Peptidyl-arginine deiminase, Porphyromonas-type [Cordyceps fumosorosea ARSEF 2679]